MVAVEICIQCDTKENVYRDVQAAFAGGAARVELCGEMQYDGLTPNEELIKKARAAFHTDGLMVMIRPRSGNFYYTRTEVLAMSEQIRRAAAAGADGVVIGALRESNGRLDCGVLAELVSLSKSYDLDVTLHRAFDATADPLEALEAAVKLTVDRVLTSGTPWGTTGGALQANGRLNEIIRQADHRVEIVLAGGVNPGNVAQILRRVPNDRAEISVHAFSGVQENGIVRADCVKALLDKANSR